MRQLEYFVAVAEEGNFTRAAGRVRISQSGVSAQIQQLERELGAALFDRSGRTVTVTEAGEAALVHARAALAAVDAVRNAVGEITGLLRGRIVVGMVIGCTVTALFDALERFHATHPGVEIAVIEDNSDRLVDAVRAGTVDVALVGTAGGVPSRMESFTIVAEGLCALVPSSHPFAGRAGIPLGELVRAPLVCMPKGTGIRTALERSCAMLGLTPSIALEASAAAAIIDLAARGLGVAVLSESMAVGVPEGVAAVPVGDAETPALLSLVWRRGTRPSAAEFVRRCRASFGASSTVAG